MFIHINYLLTSIWALQCSTQQCSSLMHAFCFGWFLGPILLRRQMSLAIASVDIIHLEKTIDSPCLKFLIGALSLSMWASWVEPGRLATRSTMAMSELQTVLTLIEWKPFWFTFMVGGGLNADKSATITLDNARNSWFYIEVLFGPCSFFLAEQVDIMPEVAL